MHKMFFKKKHFDVVQSVELNDHAKHNYHHFKYWNPDY